MRTLILSIFLAAAVTANATMPNVGVPYAPVSVGMWTSTGVQTNADGLCWNEQVAGDPDVYDWAAGDGEIRIIAPGTYIIQTRIPVYGAPRQPLRPYVGLTISTGAEQISQDAQATKLGHDTIGHLLVFVKAEGTDTSYVTLGFGADELGWTQGAVLIIEKIK